MRHFGLISRQIHIIIWCCFVYDALPVTIQATMFLKNVIISTHVTVSIWRLPRRSVFRAMFRAIYFGCHAYDLRPMVSITNAANAIQYGLLLIMTIDARQQKPAYWYWPLMHANKSLFWIHSSNIPRSSKQKLGIKLFTLYCLPVAKPDLNRQDENLFESGRHHASKNPGICELCQNYYVF